MNHLALKITKDQPNNKDNESYIGISCPYCGGQQISIGGKETYTGYRIRCIICQRDFWVKLMHIKTKPKARTRIQRWSGRKPDEASTEL